MSNDDLSPVVPLPYHSSASHRHNHTVSSISHISRATIPDDELQSVPVQSNAEDEGEKESPPDVVDRSAPPSHIRSKSVLVDQIHSSSMPMKFESFSSSTFTPSTGRRPSVACLNVNVNAARAGKHRIEHLESPALVLETGYDEGHADPEKYHSSSSVKPRSPNRRLAHGRQPRPRLAIPNDGPALTDPWSAYLDTSCDSASNFTLQPTEKKSMPRTRSLTDSADKSKKHLLSFVIGEHHIALSKKEAKQVVVIEPQQHSQPEHHHKRLPTFIISQGKSITEALDHLSVDNKSKSRTSRRSRICQFSPKEIAGLRKTLVETCTLIVDEAIKSVCDDNKFQRRHQRRRSMRQDSFNDMISEILNQKRNTWYRMPRHSQQRKSWNAAEPITDSNSDETSLDDDSFSLSDDGSELTERMRSVLQR